MNWRKPFVLTLGLVGIVGMLPLLVVAAPQAGPRASEKLDASLVASLESGASDFVIVFSEQADLSPAYSMGWEERGRFVYDSLRKIAESSQSQAKLELDRQGLTYRTFIAGNELYVVSGSLTAANEVAGLAEVSRVRSAGTYYIEPLVESQPELQTSSGALAWGIADTQADEFWATFGVQGEGVVVANIDSGVQWDHPALDQAYRCGSDSEDPDCWEDPSNICGGAMCDNNGHGTHTMGTMVGDDDDSLVWKAGMAPGAEWIACKGCEYNSCSDFALSACADWVLAPGNDPDNRPHIVNNSWGGDGCNSWYRDKVIAWRAAGIFPAFSAGNNTYSCNSLGSPGDYAESFSTTGHSSTRDHYGSRGPSWCFGHTPYTKPNISGPAVSVCSSVPGNQWDCSYTGTSMASPHSAGAVALLWSCNPGLVGQMDATFEALQDSADTASGGVCGAPPDGEGNYTSGYGFLNVYEAGLASCLPWVTGEIEGYVRESGSGDPIQGAYVVANPDDSRWKPIRTGTNEAGYYRMEVAVGTHQIIVNTNVHHAEVVSGINVDEDQVVPQDFYLVHLNDWCAQFTCFYLPAIAKH
ncbi:S8 family serine peptidase [Chloroflexota bacterium]